MNVGEKAGETLARHRDEISHTSFACTGSGNLFLLTRWLSPLVLSAQLGLGGIDRATSLTDAFLLLVQRRLSPVGSDDRITLAAVLKPEGPSSHARDSK